MANSLGTLLVNVEANTTQLIQGFNRAETAVNKTTKQMTYAVKGLIGAFVGLNTLDIAKNFTTQLDKITSANNKLKLVTKTTEEFTIAQKRLFEVAQITSAGYSETVTLYSKLSDSMGKMGKSQADIIRTVETVNKTIALSGSTASEASAAILQLGQAFGSGRLQGDELKSISENAQGLALAIAEGMGVAVGELKQLGSEGKITSEILATALEKVATSTDEKYGKMTKTIAQSMQIVSNSISKAIAEFDKITGISNVISENILSISKSLESVNSNDLESLFNTFKLGTELIVGTYIALKILKGGQSAYNSVLEYTNSISKQNIDIENSKAKAYSDGMRASYARKVADEALNTGMLNGDVLKQKQIKSLQVEANQLENTAKKQIAYSYGLESTAKSFSLASIGATALKTAMSTIPFIAITTGIGLIADSLLTASKNSDKFKDSLQKTYEELQKLTTSQLQVRINAGEDEIKKTRAEIDKLKIELNNLPDIRSYMAMGNASGSIKDATKNLENQKLALQDNIDTLQQQVTEYENLKNILESINNQAKGTTFVNIKTVLPKEDSSIINFLVNGKDVVEKQVNIKVNAPLLAELNEDVKSLIAPIDVIYDKYAKLFQNLTESGKSTAENVAKIQKAMNEEIDNLDKEAVQKRKDAERDKLKAVEDAENKRKDLIKESLDLTVSEVDKVNNKFLEMYNASFSTLNEEQKIAFTKKWQEEVEKVNGTLDAQKEKQDLINQALAVATNEIDSINNKYLEMFEAIKDNPLFDDEKMTEFYKKWQDEIDKTKEKLDFNTTIELDIIGDDKSIQRIEKSFQDLNKATKHYEENRAKIKKGSEEEAQNEEMFRKDQMNGYINMAGAIGSMFEQGSKEAAAFQVAQTSLALVEGTRAILTAGTGDPYTAIPRMIAMGAMVSSLLGNIGVAFGMNKTSESTTSDSISSLNANDGAGTVLGDTTKQSESIAKAMGILEDFAEPQFEVLQSMNNYLETIVNSIGGVSRLLIQSGQYGKAFGEGFTPTSTDTGWKGLGVSYQGINNQVTNKIEDSFKTALGKDIGGITGKLFTLPTVIANKAIGSVISGIFGKTSTTTSTKLTDSGIYFADQLLTNARDEIYGSMYQTIQKKTTTTSKSWFSSSTSTKKKIYTNMYDMEGNTELERQFSLILDSMYRSTFEASKSLDFTAEEITSTLDNFVVSIGKISLKGLSGDQIQERLTSVFGSISDKLAATAFPLLVDFQQVGEGMYTTMTRVATGMEEARFYIDRLGTSTIKYTDIINKQGVVGFEALAQSIIKADEATYGLNNGVVQMIGNMSATTEELYNTYLTFGNIRDILQVTNQSASNLSSSMILGAGSISALESGTKSYMENFLSDNERLNIQLARLSDEFKNAGYAMPKTRQGFIDLVKSIDTSTDEGAKSYGRLISLSDSYNDTISEIEDNLSTLIATFSNLGDSVAQTIATLAGADSDSQTATNQIKSFWEKRKEIDSLLALNGNLTETQQSRLSTLVGEVNSLATNIQGQSSVSSTITSELISNLTGLKDSLNLSEQILSVNIVGVASNVSLIENIAGINATVPSLVNNTSNYVTTSELSTEIKDILTTIKDNIYNYPRKTFEILDNVVNGNQKVKVQS